MEITEHTKNHDNKIKFVDVPERISKYISKSYNNIYGLIEILNSLKYIR